MPAAKIRIERRVNVLKELLDLKSGNKILECGCGTGDFTTEIAKALNKEIKIYAVDLLKSQIEIAVKKNSNLNIQFLVGSITKLNFDDNYFDSVIGNAILHHLDINIALEEIKRILKPGGKLLFFEPNMLNPHIWLSLNIRLFRKLYQASPDETAFFRWELEKKLKSQGFKNVTVKPFDFMYPLLPQNLLELVKKVEIIVEKTFLNEIAGSLITFAKK